MEDDGPRGTFNCPICNRDYPHGGSLHDADKDLLIHLLEEGRYNAERIVKISALRHQSERGAEQAARQIAEAIEIIRANPLERIVAGLATSVRQ